MSNAASAHLPFCRDCGAPALAQATAQARRCQACKSPRLLSHAELHDLSIAHLDCDAFYAAVEKRDNPSLSDKPVIIGGGTRGVVSTCCYIARIHGVRSAMPMFKALQLCPDATVIRPNMEKYAKAGAEVRAKMRELTPLVEPLSIDEAFMDLTGTARLHNQSPAQALAKLAREIEREIGISVSIGLSHNKFLAKLASDLDKPRGFSIIGREETLSFLSTRKVSSLWGVGKAFEAELAKNGITMVSQLQSAEKNDLLRRFGSMGAHIWHLARGEDHRKVDPESDTKSIGAETTFNKDIRELETLEAILWEMTEKASRRAKEQGLAGRTITLKLKTSDFKTRSRAATLSAPTQLAWRMFQATKPLLKREVDGTAYRLIGISVKDLSPAEAEVETGGLDPDYAVHAKAEKAIDKLRAKFGDQAVFQGLSLKKKDDRH